MPDYSDTSFMIAINVPEGRRSAALKRREGIAGRSAAISQRRTERLTPSFKRRSLRTRLNASRSRRFTGLSRMRSVIFAASLVGAMPLVFIDPTGWTGYPFDKIAPLFDRHKCEVVINFMYSFVSRFIDHPDEKIIASLNPILGGPGWKDRLDPSLPKGLAVEKALS